MENFDDKIGIVLNDAEMTTINTSIAAISNVFMGKLVTLPAEDRTYYGRLGPKNEVFATESASIMSEQPSIIPALLDKDEFEKDWKAYKQLTGVLNLLAPIVTSMEDSTKLLGYDLLQDAYTFQNYLYFLAENNQQNSRELLERLKTTNPLSKRRSKKTPPPSK